ncbi:MAG: hypothetical protein AAFV97_01275 [Bacteroidota bacterium]
MKTQNQKRPAAFILLISMLLQNCGVDVPVEQPEVLQPAQQVVDPIQDDAQQDRFPGQLLADPEQELESNAAYRSLVDQAWDQRVLQGDPQSTASVMCDATDKAATFQALEKLSLASLQKDTLVLDKDAVQEILEGRQLPPMLDDNRCWLLQKIGQQYKFPYLALQEYFAGRRLARLCLSDHASDQAMLTHFMKGHIYTPHHRRTLCFMARELVEDISQATEAMQETQLPVRHLLNLVSMPQEILGLQRLTLQLRLINEFLITEEARSAPKTTLDTLEGLGIDESLERWFKEGLRHYRKSEAPSQVIQHTLLSLLAEASAVRKQYGVKLMLHVREALQDNDSHVRVAAMEALPIFIADVAETSMLLTPIQSALQDEDSDVRRTGLVSLQEIASKGVSISSLLPGIQAFIHDGSCSVRKTLSTLFCTLIEQDKKIPGLSTLIQTMLQDNAWDVRGAAVKVLQTASRKNTELSEIWPFIQQALSDSVGSVRATALDALHTLLVVRRVSPSACLVHVQNACQDAENSVREAALTLLPTLVEQGAELAVILPWIQQALRDWNGEVRETALSALTALSRQGGPRVTTLPTFSLAFQEWGYYAFVAFQQALPALRQVGVALPSILTYLQKFRTLQQPLPTLSQEEIVSPDPPNASQGDTKAGSGISAISVHAALQALEQGAAMSAVFSTMQQALQDDEDLIRSVALEALPTLVDKGLAASQALPYVRDGFNDASPTIRRSALVAMQALVRANVEVAGAASYIQQAFQDSELYVRVDAVNLLRALVDKGAPISVVLPLIQQVLSDTDRMIMYAVRDILRLLVAKCPSEANEFPHVQQALQHNENIFHTIVREDFQDTLERLADVTNALPLVYNALQQGEKYLHIGALNAMPTLLKKSVDVSAVYSIVQSSLQHDENDVRLAASQSLALLAEKSPSTEGIFTLIQQALQDSEDAVRATAKQALADTPTEFMMNYYWATKDVCVISLLVPRLYQDALTVQGHNGSGQQKLVLHPTEGKSVQWERSCEEAEHFKQLIQNAAPCCL